MSRPRPAALDARRPPSCSQELYGVADALAQVPGGPTPRAARIAARLHQCRSVHGIHAAGRRPEFCRRPGGDGRAVHASTAQPVVVMGHEKGNGHQEPGYCSGTFGMARPEGYRKAVRLMELADTVRPAGDHAGRYRRGLSRQGRGRTRPVRGDRPLDREPVCRSDRAADFGDHRRGRLGWGGGVCHG